ncbi:MAG: hypothetical protein M5U14_00300 [Acidimicrobiia bacterium]|nr:hypothetical protein [Acidimicrobiia bacterium]
MSRSGSSRYGPLFWAALVVGGGTMVFGVAGAVSDLDGGERLRWAAWLVGLDLFHDLLLAPAVVLLGVLLGRLVPAPWRPPVQAGLVGTGLVLLVAWAPLRGTAEKTGNPTIQPLDYGTATLTVLAVVWSLAAVWAVARLVAARRAERLP